MSRISFAFRSFFAILFGSGLPPDIAAEFGFVKPSEKAASTPKAAPKPTVPEIKTSDGALQILAILQRDARLIDFFMEDISAYSDDQVGAAVRTLHEQSRAALVRYVTLAPVIDAVEHTVTRVDSRDPSTVRLLGNVPADGKVTQGILRHKGWKVERVDLPKVSSSTAHILAPAEVEVE
ncbi:MAG: DUF2760 domain-containing protein [Bryobacteraceae bacterium]|nr:DUF2760 domain-containing protein [Bryobacteraceae bacterium]